MPACPHYPSRKGLHSADFRGIVEALTECLYTISGVSTSFTIDPSGYAWNFEGIVQAIEDLNWTLSGVGGGGGGTITAGSGLYTTSSGTVINVNYNDIFQNSVSGHLFGQGGVSITYSGNSAVISGGTSAGGGGTSVTVSGGPGTGFSAGALWFDTNEGRLFIYASGNGVTDPDWYQTNAEALAYKSEIPPSGAGVNSPPRDGSLWFNQLMGSLFVYDATSSGWYETGPSRGAAYSDGAPAPTAQGALWVDSTVNRLKVWNGSSWVDLDIDGGVY